MSDNQGQAIRQINRVTTEVVTLKFENGDQNNILIQLLYHCNYSSDRLFSTKMLRNMQRLNGYIQCPFALMEMIIFMLVT